MAGLGEEHLSQRPAWLCTAPGGQRCPSVIWRSRLQRPPVLFLRQRPRLAFPGHPSAGGVAGGGVTLEGVQPVHIGSASLSPHPQAGLAEPDASQGEEGVLEGSGRPTPRSLHQGHGCTGSGEGGGEVMVRGRREGRGGK